MTNVTPNAGNAKLQTSAEIRQIGAKWGKFSEQYLSALKDKNDLVAQIVAKWTKLLWKANRAPRNARAISDEVMTQADHVPLARPSSSPCRLGVSK